MNQEIAPPYAHPPDEAPAPPAPAEAPAPLALAHALERFRREARRGTHDTGRYLCPYYEWGQGPPLVFIHGMADDALSFVLPISRLSAHFRCVAYDLPSGWRDSARLGAYRHRHLVDDLFSLLDHLRLDQAYLFGSSFGSTVTLAAMHEQPHRFPRAILQGGFARRPLAVTEVMLAQLARYWPGTMRVLPMRKALLEQVHYPAFAGREAAVWDYYMEQNCRPPIAAVARRALLVHGTDLRRLLSEIRQPVLLVCGSHDPLVGKACEAELLRGLPNASRVELENCGHLPYFTHPELLAEVVLRFLTPLPCGTGGGGCDSGGGCHNEG